MRIMHAFRNQAYQMNRKTFFYFHFVGAFFFLAMEKLQVSDQPLLYPRRCFARTFQK